MTDKSASHNPNLAPMIPAIRTQMEVMSGLVSGSSHLPAVMLVFSMLLSMVLLLITSLGSKGDPGHQMEARQSVREATSAVMPTTPALGVEPRQDRRWGNTTLPAIPTYVK